MQSTIIQYSPVNPQSLRHVFEILKLFFVEEVSHKYISSFTQFLVQITFLYECRITELSSKKMCFLISGNQYHRVLKNGGYFIHSLISLSFPHSIEEAQ